ncbi:MAG: replication-relaxation family protein [Chloroflexota bacterium]|nr:replication-relaxation family protein [Chloroflexota bacterium]
MNTSRQQTRPRHSTVTALLREQLVRLPLQREEDLHITCPAMDARTVYRHLARLVADGTVEWVRFPLRGQTSPRLYHLSRRGLVLAARDLGRDPVVLASTVQADERGLLGLLPRLPWLVRLHDMVNALLTHAPTALALQGRPPTVTWHWQREYVEVLSAREEDQRLRVSADAALLLHITHHAPLFQEQWAGCLILLDTGLLPGRIMRARLHALYRARARWEQQGIACPLVLILVNGRHRVSHWQRIAVELARLAGVAPLHGCVTALPHGGQPTTTWNLPWVSLATAASVSLRDALIPTPISTLPVGMHWRSLREMEPGEDPRPARTQRRLIQGRYLARSRQVSTWMKRDRRTSLGLLSLCLRATHRALLDLLFVYPFLSAGEVAAFLDIAPATARRYLFQMREYTCVTAVPLPVDHHSAPEERWQVSSRGLQFLAASHHLSIKSIARPASSASEQHYIQQEIAGLRLNAEHTAGIYRFMARLTLDARAKGHRLLWWEQGYAREQFYAAYDAWRHVRPDALAEYQAGKRRVRFWLEWTRATVGVQDLEEKVQAYRRYITLREWAREGAVLPIILLVTPDGGHEERVWRVARSILASTSLTLRTTTSTRIEHAGPLAPIWYEVLSTSQDDQPRRLFYDMRARAESDHAGRRRS